MPSENKGYHEALDRVVRAMIQGRLAQAYLVVGPPQGEALRFAVDVLQHLFCEKSPEACDACSACRQACERRHPDIVWIEPQLKSRTIAIEEIRVLQKQIYQTSFAGGWKAAVIVGADRLGVAGKSEAGNAFLKTLEEPPPRTLFLLLTDAPDMVLPTILSRCQRIVLTSALYSLSAERLAALLDILKMGQAIDPMLKSMARANRFAKIMEEIRDVIEEEESAEAKKSENKIDKDVLEARIEARAREERTALLRAMKVWYRDLLLCVCGADPALLSFSEHQALLKSMAERLTCRQALANMETIENMQRQLSRNIVEDVVFTMGFARLTA